MDSERCKNRHGRFRQSDLLRRLFETVLSRCIEEGFVGGEGFAVDGCMSTMLIGRRPSPCLRAMRIVSSCVYASDGVRWEIAHVLQSGHADKTLFFLYPSPDVQTRTRLLTEDFGVSAADLASVNVDSILGLRATSRDQSILMFCAKPDRDAYLVVPRLAFEGTVGCVAPE